MKILGLFVLQLELIATYVGCEKFDVEKCNLAKGRRPEAFCGRLRLWPHKWPSWSNCFEFIAKTIKFQNVTLKMKVKDSGNVLLKSDGTKSSNDIFFYILPIERMCREIDEIQKVSSCK